jgi:hypothetical protein
MVVIRGHEMSFYRILSHVPDGLHRTWQHGKRSFGNWMALAAAKHVHTADTSSPTHITGAPRWANANVTTNLALTKNTTLPW